MVRTHDCAPSIDKVFVPCKAQIDEYVLDSRKHGQTIVSFTGLLGDTKLAILLRSSDLLLRARQFFNCQRVSGPISDLLPAAASAPISFCFMLHSFLALPVILAILFLLVLILTLFL